MKPRLQVAPLTPEDFAIWDAIASPYRLRQGVPEWCFIQSDRRDALKMCEAALWGSVLERTVRPFAQTDGGFAHRYHRALWHRFLATGERPRLDITKFA